VETELRIPRVEDREKAELAAQTMPRIGAEGQERVGDGLEEDLIEGGLVGRMSGLRSWGRVKTVWK
jgi:hypothetical protein